MEYFNIEYEAFQSFFIILLRVSGLFVYSPVFGAANFPKKARYFTAFVFSLVFFNLVTSKGMVLPQNDLELLILLVREFSIGFLIGFSGMLVLNAVQFAGKMIDMGMGLHMARVLDPLSREQASVIGQLIYTFMMFLLFSANAHYFFIEALAYSYDAIPIGEFIVSGTLIQSLFILFMNIFVVGFKIALPIAGIMFVLTFTLGVLAKAVPQINVFFVGLPLKLMLGLFLLGFSFHMMYPYLEILVKGMRVDLMSVLNAVM